MALNPAFKDTGLAGALGVAGTSPRANAWEHRVLWSTIVIEPCAIGARRRVDDACCYVFRLPVISDGRPVYTLLRRHPELAEAARCVGGRARHKGLIDLVDGQWALLWHGIDVDRPADMRLIGSRFHPGERIGLRPFGGALSLFEVAAVSSASPADYFARHRH